MDSDLHRCFVCTTVTRFTNDDSLREHLLASHPKQKSYQCGKCGNKSTDIRKFNQHLARHESNLPFKCSFCMLGFRRDKTKIHHEGVVHKVPGYRVPEKKRSCPTCGKKFPTEYRVKLHVCSTTRELLHGCPKCSERFPSQRQLTLHRRARQCSKNIGQKEESGADTIVSSCDPRRLTSIKCYLCAKNPIFAVKALLDEHLSTVHAKIEAYTCEECNLVLKSTEKINYHLSRHDASERPHKCSVCSLRFVTENHKKRHEVSAHTISNWHSVSSVQKCLICGDGFACKRSLRKHMMLLHQKQASENAFWCYLCSTVVRFDDNDSLAEHLAATHSEQESYSCTECNISLHGRTVFNWHLSTHDATVRPFKCTICPKRFKNRWTKRQHEHFHSFGSGNGSELQSLGQKSLEHCQNELPDEQIIPEKAETQACGAIKSEEVHIYDEFPLEESNFNDSVEQADVFLQNVAENRQNELADQSSIPEKAETQVCGAIKSEEVHIYDERPLEQSNFNDSVEQADVIPQNVTENRQNELAEHFNIPEAETQDYGAIKSEEVHIYGKRSLKESNFNESVEQADVILQDVAENRQKELTDKISSSEATETETRGAIKSEELHIYDECPPEESNSNESVEQADTIRQDAAAKKMKKSEVNLQSNLCYLCCPVKRFYDGISFYVHLSTHATQKAYYCKHCDKSFNNVLGYNVHFPQHEDDAKQTEHEASTRNIDIKKHVCLNCGKWFTFESELHNHDCTPPIVTRQKSVPNAKSSTSAVARAKNTSTSVNRQAPSRKRLHITPVIENTKCYLCSDTPQFEGKVLLDIHILSVHVDQDKYECSECDMTIQHPVPFNLHLSQHDIRNQIKAYVSTVSIKQPREDPVAIKPRFECYLCSNTPQFEDKTSLDIHILSVHVDQDTYKCDECNTTMRSALTFNVHLSRHDRSIRPFRCSICSLRFTSRDCLLSHEYRVHNIRHREAPRRHHCPACGEEFEYKSELGKHTLSGKCGEQAPNENNLRCHICSGAPQFDALVSLNEHLSTEHSKQEEHNCDECDETFVTVAAFNQHLSLHDVNARRYKCIVCPMLFLTRTMRTKHESIVHNIDAEQQIQSPSDDFFCLTCGNEFGLKSDLKEHTRAVHGEILSDIPDLLTCYLCETSTKFEYQTSFNAHMSTSHATEDEYKCKECNVTTTNKYLFNHHLSRHDAGLRPFKCKKCPLRFISNNNRTFHEYHVHREQNKTKHDCTFCEEQFTYLSSLSAHIREVHGNREIERTPKSIPHKCYLCSTPVSFEERAFLISHLLSVHANQEDYTCQECNLTIATTTAINRHHAQHDSITRPNKCTICPLRFIEQEDRECHEANVHGMSNGQSAIMSRSISCKTCGKLFPYKCRLKRHKCKGTRQKKRAFRCYLCNGAIIPGKRQFLVQHLETAHPAQDKYICQHCTFTTPKLLAFNQHLSRHVVQGTEQNMTGIVTYQQQSVPSASAFETSKTVAKNSLARSLRLKKHSSKCYLCNTHIGSKQSLKEHLETAHALQSLYHCRKCSFFTSDKRTYNNHQMRHDRSVRQYKCRFCSLRYFSVQYRGYHEQYEHAKGTKQLIYTCPQCDEKFSSKWRLKLHKKNTSHIVLKVARKDKSEPQETEQPHNSEPINRPAVETKMTPSAITEVPSSSTATGKDVRKVLDCYICSPTLQFMEQASLDAHLKAIHTGNKFECSECKRRFVRSYRLNRHLSLHDATLRPFKCTVCPARFTLYVNRNRHEEQNHNVKEKTSKLFDCPTCGKKFILEARLGDHMRTAHGTLRYACASCGKTYPSEQKLKLHKNDAHNADPDLTVQKKAFLNDKPNRCYLCLITTQFENKRSLLEHLSKKHHKQQTSCDECSMTFDTISQVNDHRKRHDIHTRPYKCSVCPLRFYCSNNQRYHEYSVHNIGKDVRKNHICPYCSKAFRYESQISKHKCKSQQRNRNEPAEPVKTTNAQPKKLFQCYLCTDSTIVGSRSLLVRHLAAKHYSRDGYTCQQCDFSSLTLFPFNEHLSQHVAGATRPGSIDELETTQTTSAIGVIKVVAKDFACATCDRRFEFECSKIRHERYMHPTIKCSMRLRKHSFKCYLCNTQNESKESLMKHLETIHAQRTLLLKCRKCPFSTTRKQNYNNHQMLHDRSKRRYKCRFCSLRYITARYRKCHEQFEHANSYACADCDKKFSFKWQVKLHEKNTSHTAHKIIVDIKTEPQENDQQYDEQPHNIEWIHQAAIKTEEVHIYSELPAEEIASPHEAFHETQQAVDDSEMLSSSSQSSYKRTKCEYTRPYKCCFCTKTFRTTHDMLLHKASTHSLYPEVRRLQLQQHEQSMRHAAATCSSKRCDAGIQPTSAEKAPAKRSQPKRRICRVCRKRVLLDRYDQHMHTEHDVKKLACPTCEMEFDSGDTLKQHELVAHGIADPHMQIPTRMESSSTSTVPHRDVLTSDAPIELYDAVKLEEEFVFSEHPGLIYATSAVKNDQPFHDVPSTSGNFNASGCSSSTFIPEELSYPIKTEAIDHANSTSDATKAFRCHLCNPGNLQLESRDALEQHLLSSHPARDMYYCEKCGFSVNLITLFNQHLAQHYLQGQI